MCISIFCGIPFFSLFFVSCFSFAEYVDVGTEKVLASPHVSEGPGRIANSPVPSIYMDDRGEIHRFRVGGTRINMLFSKKDVMRSGYLHNHKTFAFVIKGKVELWLLEKEGTVKTVYGAGSFFQVCFFAILVCSCCVFVSLKSTFTLLIIPVVCQQPNLQYRLILFIHIYFTFWKIH